MHGITDTNVTISIIVNIFATHKARNSFSESSQTVNSVQLDWTVGETSVIEMTSSALVPSVSSLLGAVSFPVPFSPEDVFSFGQHFRIRMQHPRQATNSVKTSPAH